eukprot:776183-Pyramimonas_sp.AAC.2
MGEKKGLKHIMENDGRPHPEREASKDIAYRRKQEGEKKGCRGGGGHDMARAVLIRDSSPAKDG